MPFHTGIFQGEIKMTEIIIIRHAEAEGNAKRIFHGQYNSVLTEKGHRQADATGKFLADTKIERIYSSDLTRTYMTAHHVAAYQGCDIIKMPDLREVNAGSWENTPFADLQEKYPETFASWQADTFAFAFPDGESVKEVTERVGKCIDMIAAENDGKRIAIVSHATPIHCIKFYYEEMTAEERQNHGWVTNASVSRCIYKDGRLEFLSYGENSFLSDIN